jgi:hypothetical protein
MPDSAVLVTWVCTVAKGILYGEVLVRFVLAVGPVDIEIPNGEGLVTRVVGGLRDGLGVSRTGVQPSPPSARRFQLSGTLKKGDAGFL